MKILLDTVTVWYKRNGYKKMTLNGQYVGFEDIAGRVRLAASPQLPAHAGSSLADCNTLKMEAIRSSGTSVQSTTSTRRHTPKDGNFQLNGQYFKDIYMDVCLAHSIENCCLWKSLFYFLTQITLFPQETSGVLLNIQTFCWISTPLHFELRLWSGNSYQVEKGIKSWAHCVS
jgi:hypothetical protein